MARRVVHVAIALALVVATAGCIVTAGDTSQITLVSTTTESGWTFTQYRNTAYTCSMSGFQTFTIATKVGSPANAKAPLWVWMHGGGVGYFDSVGNPLPDALMTTEESAATQRESLLNPGLLTNVRADAKHYRLLAVSYCDRDLYSGTGGVDPHDPSAGASGGGRMTNGMLETKAAIQFAQAKFPTSATILHGTSAGAVGAYYVAWGLEAQGIPPAGVVGDASVMNVEADAAAYAQGSCRKLPYSPAGQAGLAARIDPSVADPANEIDRIVESRQFRVPLLHIWNHGDTYSCGNNPVECPLHGGSVVKLGTTDCQHRPLAIAIARLGPSSTSKNLPLCVSTDGHAGECDKHGVTTAAALTNTDRSSPPDYLDTILQWADARVSANAG